LVIKKNIITDGKGKQKTIFHSVDNSLENKLYVIPSVII
jgi:hypothetical protein